jgi:hypothetical protein
VADVLTDEQINALELAESGGLPDVLTDDQMSAFEVNLGPQQGTGSRLGNMLTQFGAGGVEGIVGMGGLIGDILSVPGRLGERAGQYALDAIGIPHEEPRPWFRYSTAGKEVTDAVLPAPLPGYEYERTLGQFVLPGAPMKAAGMGLKAVANSGKAANLANWLIQQGGVKAGLSSVFAGGAAQATENATGNKGLLPLGAAIVAGNIPAAATGLWGLGRSIFSGATPEEVIGSAASALKEATGLDAKTIREAVDKLPKDRLSGFKTTAEITDNAAMAQVEKELAKTGEQANFYVNQAKAREAAREGMLNRLSGAKAVNPEGLGSDLITKAGKVKGEMNEAAEQLWNKFPRFEELDVTPYRSAVMKVVAEKQAGLVQDLVNQFGKVDEETGKAFVTSGALQDIRSDALTLSREKNLMNHDKKILAALQSETDQAAKAGLSGDAYKLWREARAATSKTAETFKKGTAGGSLMRSDLRPSNALENVFKGDTKSIIDLRKAIGNDPELLDQVRRGVLDMIPRAQTGLTPAKVENFLAANAGAARELFGKEGYDAIRRVAKDLKSQANVNELANYASKGQSATSQKGTVAGVLSQIIVDKTEKIGGTLGSVISGIKAITDRGDTAKVRELLFRAAMDPATAIKLAEAPTTERVVSAAQWLGTLAKEGAGTTARVTGSALARPEGEEMRENTLLMFPNGGRAPIGSTRSLPRNPQPVNGGLLSPRSSAQGDKADSIDPLTWLFDSLSPQTALAATPDLPFGSGDSLGPVDTRSLETGLLQEKSESMSSPKGTLTSPEMESLLDAVREVESSGGKKNTGPITKHGTAKGPYQLIDRYGKAYHKQLGIKEKYDPYDEKQSRQIAKAMMEDNLRWVNGDVKQALLAYHTGIGNIRRGEIGPEGKKYAGKVFAALEKLGKDFKLA